MSNATDTELLIQLLDGDLPESSRQELLRRLENDPALQVEWDTLSASRELLAQYGKKKQIASIHSEMMAELASTLPASGSATDGQRVPLRSMAPVRPLKRFMIPAVAAALVIIIFAALYPYFSATPETLFAGQFSAYAAGTRRGESPSELEKEYQAGNWEKTVAGYRAGAARNPQDDFLAGNAFLRLHEPAAAIDAFRAAMKANLDAGTHYLEPDTEYYLALAWLAADKPAEALPLLQRIHEDAIHPYHGKVSWWFLQKVRRLASH